MNKFSYIIIGALIVVILFLGFKSCHKPTTTVVHIDTISHTDTVYKNQPVMHDTIHTPKVVVYIPGDVVPMPPPDDAECNDLYNAYTDLLDSLDGTNVQKDNVVLKDSSGKKVGIVNILDSVRSNRIYARSVNYQLSFPIITNTLTITKLVTQHKNSFYVGGGLQGNKVDIISGANAGLLWQNKQGGIFGAGVVYDNTQHLNFQIQKYWKLGKNK